MNTAVAYFRTSSAANVGEDKDSLPRQREAVKAYAKRNKLTIANEFYDAAQTGADSIDNRDGFQEMLAYIRNNGARTILVENAGRFARDLAVQITAHQLLKAEGFELIPVDAPDYFIEETPTAVMVRNILGAVSQFQKDELVLKLSSARKRKRKANKDAGIVTHKGEGKCEGRKPLADTHPDMVKEAKRLRRKNPKSGKVRSYRAIAAELAAAGYTRPNGEPHNAMTIRSATTH
jgi:DNA invertase Pin-like site-specific DNA recombinase